MNVIPLPFEPPMIRISWIDSVVLQHHWQHVQYYINSAKSLAMVEHSTVGYLIEENDNYVIVALCIRRDGAMMSAVTIPKFSITKMWSLEQGEIKNG